jgi:rare lipoprotein A
MKRYWIAALLACAAASSQAQQEGEGSAELEAAAEVALVAADTLGQVVEATLAQAVAATPPPSQSGIASWYGPGFHGRKTANGETFNMDALTAAHRWLPFGSLVGVQKMINGRSVDVRINDRGPFIKQRIIDLSRAAAKALGLGGTKQVELTLLDKGR